MTLAVCPSREELQEYLVGKLPDDASDSLAEHLDACPECQAALATLPDSDDTLVARLKNPDAPDPYAGEPNCQEALARARNLFAANGAGGKLSPDASTTMFPQQLGEYQLIERLGRGGMGTVYKAMQSRLDRVVALKVLARGRTGDARAVVRFEREMKAIGRLDHPNIVKAYDAREIDGTLVLIMEYIAGLDLADLVRRTGPLPLAEACELIRQTALALQYAHEHGLVHRDIKPSNVMLSRSGEVKLLDLGLARFFAGNAVSSATGILPVSEGDVEVSTLPHSEEMTGTGQAMGTADYISPEQASDSRTVDIRADIYSLGCTLYRLLSGQAPFGGSEYRGTLEKMHAHVHETPPPIKELVPDLPEEVANIVDRMLAKDPADRFSVPSEVAIALQPFCHEADLTALITKAIALPREQWAKTEKTHDANFSTRRSAVAPNRRRPFVRNLLIGMGFFGAIALSFYGGILITIERDGKPPTTLEATEGSKIKVNEQGNIKIELPPGEESEYVMIDLSAKDGMAMLPPEPYTIGEGDYLYIRASFVIPDAPIDGIYRVEPMGTVPLSPAYGRVKLVGLSLVDAEKTLREQLKEVLRDPGTSITLAGWKKRVPGSPPPEPHKIAPGDILNIWASFAIPDQLIQGPYLVESDGQLTLGPAYGRVNLKGLTFEEAEAAVRNKLGEVLRNPEVSITLEGWRKLGKPLAIEKPSEKIRPSVQRSIAPNPPGSDKSKTPQPVWESLGLELREIPAEEFRTTNKSRYRGGLSVTAVRPNSPAASAGLKIGDVLVGIHERETASMENLTSIIKELTLVMSDPYLISLSPVKFFILRGDETLYGNFTLFMPADQKANSLGNAQNAASEDDAFTKTLNDLFSKAKPLSANSAAEQKSSNKQANGKNSSESLPAESQIKIFHLQNGDAASMINVVQKLLPEKDSSGHAKVLEGEDSLKPLRLSVDSRTNSIVAEGDRKTLEIIEAILTRLDSSSEWKPSEKKTIDPFSAKTESHKNQSPTFRTAKITRGDITSTVLASGVIEPEEVIEVCAQASGRIVRFGSDPRAASDPNIKDKTVDFNTPVKEGDLLAELENETYRDQLNKAKADLDKAKIELEHAQAKLHVVKAEYEAALDANKKVPNTIPQTDLNSRFLACQESELAIKTAEANCTQFEVAVKSAQRNLDYTIIKSPVNGVIIARRANVGQNVASDAKTGSLFLIAKDLGKMQVWAQVNEAVIGRIKDGMDATFTVDARPNEIFKGKVSQIHLNAQQTAGIVTYPVLISFDNPEIKLLPYMTTNVRFEIETHRNVLLVPNEALSWRPDFVPAPVFPTIHVDRTDKGNPKSFLEAIYVKTGLSDGKMTEISDIKADLAKIKEGMEVVVGDDRPSENPFQPIQPNKTRNPFTEQPPVNFSQPDIEPLFKFGLEVEKVVNAKSEAKGGEALDLAGNKLVDLPQDFNNWPVEKQEQWLKTANIDLLVDFEKNSGQSFGGGASESSTLLPKGLKLVAIARQQWDETTSNEKLRSVLNQAQGGIIADPNDPRSELGIATVREKGGIIAYQLVNVFGYPPWTFAFQTQKGELGILQVIRFTEEPKGMRIRYKMWQPNPVSSPFDQPHKNTEGKRNAENTPLIPGSAASETSPSRPQ